MFDIGYMPAVARLLRACTPKRAMPVGSRHIADIGHPRGGETGSVVRLRSGAEVFYDGMTFRSLPSNWREIAKWNPLTEV